MRKRTLSGFATLAIAVIVGGGILWIAVDYTNTKKNEALHAALVRQYNSSLKACLRGNRLRKSLNDGAIKTLHDFLVTARTARLAAVKSATTKADRTLNQKAAASYTGYLDGLGPLPRVDCQAAFTKP